MALLLSCSAYGSNEWLRRRDDKQTLAQKQYSGNRGLDGSRTLFVPYRSGTYVMVHPTKSTTFDAHKRLFLNPPRYGFVLDGQLLSAVPPRHTKPGLNLTFLHQFLALLNIMIPRWNCKESGLLLSEAAFLMLRTYLSLIIARLDGEIVRDLVAGKARMFLVDLAKWSLIGALASYTNAAIKFLQSKVSIAFRTRLTRYVHDLHLNDTLSYYKLANLDGGIGQGADQLIVHDLTLFCTSAASLYSSIGKPFIDLCVFNYQLFLSLGPFALTGLLANYFVTATILRKLSPPFGKLKAVEGHKEGSFRTLHARLITNAEEIAFYGGSSREKTFLDNEFKDLRLWMEAIYLLKIRYNMLEDFVLKYSWSAVGYLFTSLPVFIPRWGGLGKGLKLGGSNKRHDIERGRMKDFITNNRLMLSLADAGGRIMYSIKDLSELAGYTSRIYTLIATLHRVHAEAYFPLRETHSELYSLADVQGTLHKGYKGIRLEACPVIAPSLYPRGGEELIQNLSFNVQPGEHLLITGPNGVGKSAIVRIVAGLWPTYRSLVSRPRFIGVDGVMFLPQRPYLSVGTLRDQVIYPHDIRDNKREDHELFRILQDVHLGYLPGREGGWNGRKEWKNVLSGGEKQRMSIARLLYHGPRFAFIDEGTSAVSSDVEGLLYEKAKENGITLISVSTRASLRKYHTYALNLGIGELMSDCGVEKIGTEQEKMGVERELQELRGKLAEVGGWEKRKAEVEEQLAIVWIKERQGRTELQPPAFTAKDDLNQIVAAK